MGGTARGTARQWNAIGSGSGSESSLPRALLDAAPCEEEVGTGAVALPALDASCDLSGCSPRRLAVSSTSSVRQCVDDALAQFFAGLHLLAVRPLARLDAIYLVLDV